MDLYEIFIHQNPPWSSGETVCFAVFLCLFFMSVTVLVRKKKIKAVQGAAVLLIYIFLFVVFASTVFTRVPTPEPNYELQLFWSYRYVIENRSAGMLEEILLNCILLLPLGGAAAVLRCTGRCEHGLRFWQDCWSPRVSKYASLCFTGDCLSGMISYTIRWDAWPVT